MNTITFENGQEMLDTILCGNDLYNAETGEYVFQYSESGSIAVYTLNENTVLKLRQMSEDEGQYWGAFLGPGGLIYDDPIFNLDWCEAHYKGEWEVLEY